MSTDILSISRDTHTAEEITQETFFKAMKKIDNFRGESGLKVWFCQISKNTFYSYAKKIKNVQLLEEYDEPADSVEDDNIRKKTRIIQFSVCRQRIKQLKKDNRKSLSSFLYYKFEFIIL